MNPVEAGLASRPGGYAWSSHRAYLDSRRRPEWLAVDEVLGYFGSREGQAIRAFDKFISAGVPERFKRAILENPVVVGGRGFKDWVYDNLLDSGKRYRREISSRQRRPRQMIDWKTILFTTAFAHDVPATSLRRKVAGQVNQARSVAIYLTRLVTGKMHREIARLFGVTSEYAIAKAYGRVRAGIEKDKALRDLVDTIHRNILYNVNGLLPKSV